MVFVSKFFDSFISSFLFSFKNCFLKYSNFFGELTIFELQIFFISIPGSPIVLSLLNVFFLILKLILFLLFFRSLFFKSSFENEMPEKDSERATLLFKIFIFSSKSSSFISTDWHFLLCSGSSALIILIFFDVLLRNILFCGILIKNSSYIFYIMIFIKIYN